MRRAALYVRVSTDLQEREQTIQSQLAAVTRFADEHGLKHSAALTYTDDGYSGTWLDRPGLDELRDHAREGRFDVAVVLCPDRLAPFLTRPEIHWPTDSSLLWDVYRVLARLIEDAREIDPVAVGPGRVQLRRVKRLQQKICRRAANKGCAVDRLKPLYSRLIRHIEHVSQWAQAIRQELVDGRRVVDARGIVMAASIVGEIRHYAELGGRVVEQARRRVLDGESVPNEEKIFSIFEPHTELLKRGKAGKAVEFGHMIQVQQVASKFITDYGVFAKRPVEHELIASALKSHCSLFGDYPDSLAADKGYGLCGAPHKPWYRTMLNRAGET